MVAGLPVASCVVTKCVAAPRGRLPPAASDAPRRGRAPIGEGGKPVIRPYTPTSEPDAKGHFDLVVKARTHERPLPRDRTVAAPCGLPR